MTPKTNGAVVASRNQLAAKLGEVAESVRITDPQWAKALKDGAFLDLHVSRTRFKTTLTYEELGLTSSSPEEERARRRVVKLGTRYTIPRDLADEADKIDHAARRLMPTYCYRTQFGWFIYAGEDGARYKDWKQAMEKVREDYFALRDRIYDSWPELQAQVREDYRVMCQENYARLANAKLQPTEPLAEWVAARVEDMLKGQPDREDVRRSFDLTWDIKMVPLAAEMARDQAEAGRILTEAAVQNEFQRDRLASMRDANRKFADEFFKDIKANVYQAVYAVASAVLSSMQSQTALEPGAVRRLKNLLQRVENLNPDGWLNDIQLEAQMNAIYSLLGRVGDGTEAPFGPVLSRIQGEAFAVLTEIERLPDDTEPVDVGDLGEVEVAESPIDTFDAELGDEPFDAVERL